MRVHVSVPWEPRSVRRDHLPASDPSGLMVMIRRIVRLLLVAATLKTQPSDEIILKQTTARIVVDA
jgi:hypothetical protein